VWFDVRRPSATDTACASTPTSTDRGADQCRVVAGPADPTADGRGHAGSGHTCKATHAVTRPVRRETGDPSALETTVHPAVSASSVSESSAMRIAPPVGVAVASCRGVPLERAQARGRRARVHEEDGVKISMFPSHAARELPDDFEQRYKSGGSIHRSTSCRPCAWVSTTTGRSTSSSRRPSRVWTGSA
jgi:hypothetical protein